MCMGTYTNILFLPLHIKYKGKKHCVKAALSSRLMEPLIMGSDWPVDFEWYVTFVLRSVVTRDYSMMTLGRRRWHGRSSLVMKLNAQA